jgi:hypothetical protein
MKRRGLKVEESIPYEKIDCEIRPLIRLINEFPGIRTEFSCIGHRDEEDGYITFQADSQESLAILLAALPFLSWRADIVANQFRYRAVWIDVSLHSDQGLRYNLRFSGQPQYMQRQLVGEMESALRTALTGIRSPLASTA